MHGISLLTAFTCSHTTSSPDGACLFRHKQLPTAASSLPWGSFTIDTYDRPPVSSAMPQLSEVWPLWVLQGMLARQNGMRKTRTHLASTAMYDVLWGFVDLRLHVDILVLVVIHLHPQDTKGRPAEIQGDEIPLF